MRRGGWSARSKRSHPADSARATGRVPRGGSVHGGNQPPDGRAERDVFALDDPLATGPLVPSVSASYSPNAFYVGRSPQVRCYSGQAKTKVTTVIAESVTLERKIALDRLRDPWQGAADQRHGSGEGGAVAGVRPARVLELQGKMVLNTENINRRTGVAPLLRLLAGKEADPGAERRRPPTKPFTVEEIAARLGKLASGEAQERQTACANLAGA